MYTCVPQVGQCAKLQIIVLVVGSCAPKLQFLFKEFMNSNTLIYVLLTFLAFKVCMGSPSSSLIFKYELLLTSEIDNLSGKKMSIDTEMYRKYFKIKYV